MQRRRAVQKNGVILYDLVQHIPDDVTSALHLPASGFDVLRVAVAHNFTHNKWLKQFKRHFLGKTALMQFQLGTDNDDGAPGIVDALA